MYDDSAVYRSNATLLKTFFWTVARLKSRYNVVWKAYIADVDNDGRATPPNTIIRFERYHQVNNGDVKLFIPQSVRTNDFNAAMHEVEKINVFPNPYYGMNRAELDRLHRFVTFNHLPYSAVIRIFTLGGDLVKTLRKENDSQFAQWDITNESGLPVAGGLYLAYLQLSDISGRALGEKSLKLMIVPEKQSLEN